MATDPAAPPERGDVERALGLAGDREAVEAGVDGGALDREAAAPSSTPAIDEAFEHDDEVMIEQFIPGRELTVGILGDEALPVGEIIPKHEIYDYECKYTAGMARGDLSRRR